MFSSTSTIQDDGERLTFDDELEHMLQQEVTYLKGNYVTVMTTATAEKTTATKATVSSFSGHEVVDGVASKPSVVVAVSSSDLSKNMTTTNKVVEPTCEKRLSTTELLSGSSASSSPSSTLSSVRRSEYGTSSPTTSSFTHFDQIKQTKHEQTHEDRSMTNCSSSSTSDNKDSSVVFSCHSCSSAPTTSSSPIRSIISSKDRTTMIMWCYQLCDYCDYHRENVEITMSYVDRYMWSLFNTGASSFSHEGDGLDAVAGVMKDRVYFQLIVMTCFYMATKIHNDNSNNLLLHPTTMSQLSASSHCHSPEDITAMEIRILSQLQWKMNPPTSLSFVRSFLGVLLNHETIGDVVNETKCVLQKKDQNDFQFVISMLNSSHEVRSNLYDLICYQTELALMTNTTTATNLDEEVEICTEKALLLFLMKPSIIAYCSLNNAIELLFDVSDSCLLHIRTILGQSIRDKDDNVLIEMTKSFLYEQSKQRLQQHTKIEEKQQENSRHHHLRCNAATTPIGFKSLSSSSLI